MKSNFTLFILFILLQQLVFSQTNAADSLKDSFVALYKEMIDNEISDAEMNNIADSIFINAINGKHDILKRIEDFIRERVVMKEKDYLIAEGDCLWTIAAKETGEPHNWNKIYEANYSIIKNPNLLIPGQIIKITTVNQIETPDSSVSKLIKALVESEETETIKNETTQPVVYDNLEIENFIVDETLSKIGKDYFDLFYNKWETQVSGILSYSIVISERTLPQRGTQISIKVNDLDVYQSFIQPRYELIEQSVDEGIYTVFSYLQNYEAIQKDLERGDMKGSGIF
jgi:hypothetical protein